MYTALPLQQQRLGDIGWALSQHLVAFDATTSGGADAFGCAVAIYDVNAMVGASEKTSNSVSRSGISLCIHAYTPLNDDIEHLALTSIVFRKALCICTSGTLLRRCGRIAASCHWVLV